MTRSFFSNCGSNFLDLIQFNYNDKKGILVLLFHDICHDSTYPLWHWISSLNAQGISVLTIDWDGHGGSGNSYFDVQETTRSIPLILQRLFGSTGGKKLGKERKGPLCFLMGHGLGASYSLIAATRQDVSQHVAGVIALSPSIVLDKSSSIFGDAWSLFSLPAWTSDFANKFSYYGFGWIWGIIWGLSSKKFPLRAKLYISADEQVKKFVHEAFSERKLLRHVKTPVLWLHARKDSHASYLKSLPLMMEIPTAFFSYHDEERDYLRMALSDKIQYFCSEFIGRFKSSH